MALDLKQAGETITVTDAELVTDGDPETTYTLQHLTVEKNREFLKQFTKKKPNPRTHQMDDVTDFEAVADAQFDYALAEWSGVLVGGQPVPCTRRYKMLLDGIRRDAIMRRAGSNDVAQVAELRAESFRPVA